LNKKHKHKKKEKKMINPIKLLSFLFCNNNNNNIQVQVQVQSQQINNLSNIQWKQINTILSHPKITPIIRNKVNQLIYSKYETWAIHKAYVFKRTHRYNSRNINIQDLILYSLEGLQKATTKYNGKSSFHTYAEIYIHGQLYVGLTRLQAITNIPKQIRKQKEKPNYLIYKKRLNTQFVGYNDYWIFDKVNINREEKEKEEFIQSFWNEINCNTTNAFTRRIFHNKYNYYLDKIRSNKEISIQMSCSEETIRQHLKKSMIIIYKKLSSS
jgi:RNA polymerase sigma factor (sigma-70 family)